jgi:membrane protein
MTPFLKRYLIELPQRAARNWFVDDASLLAAGVAYFFAVSLFPLLLVLASIVGYIFAQTQFGRDAKQEIVAAVSNQVSPEVGQQVAKLFEIVRDEAPANGPWGLALLFIAVTAMFAQFDNAFDAIWKVPATQHGGMVASLRRIAFVRFKAFLMLLAVGALVMVTFVAGLVWNAVDTYANGITPYWSHLSWWLRPTLNLTINIAASALIFYVVPRVRVAWHHALAGGVVAGLGWEIGRQVLASYVIGRQYGSAYGVIGSFLAVILWCYYVVAVLFFGAEYSRAASLEETQHTSS